MESIRNQVFRLVNISLVNSLDYVKRDIQMEIQMETWISIKEFIGNCSWSKVESHIWLHKINLRTNIYNFLDTYEFD